MTDIDQYAFCPGGSNKKLKFCDCCRDILPQLEQIFRAIEGNQRRAALEQVTRVLATHPDRASLLSLKGTIELMLGDVKAGEKTVTTFTETHPENPVPWALMSTLQASEYGALFAIDPLQRALELTEESVPAPLSEALRAISGALINEGNPFSARAHLTLMALMSPPEDHSVLVALDRINRTASFPILFKQDAYRGDCPEEAPWLEGFQDAWSEMVRGRWLQALKLLTELRHKAPGEAVILRNLAYVHGWLCDRSSMVSTLRELAQTESLPLDDRVEAEALAQLEDQQVEEPKIDLIKLSYTLTDANAVQELLLSSRSVSPLPIDLAKMGDEENPPPRAAFHLLDRSIPEDHQGLTASTVPLSIGEIYLFGRQSDREPHLVLTVLRDDDFDKTSQAVHELLGELIVGTPEEEVLSQLDLQQQTLNWQWIYPTQTPKEVQQELFSQERERRYLECWTELPSGALGGKTAREAAGDPAFQVPLLARLLLIAQAEQAQGSSFAFEKLYAELGLPMPETIDPTGLVVPTLPLARLARIDCTKLDAEQIQHVFNVSRAIHLPASMQRASEEVVRRATDPQTADVQLYQQMLDTAYGQLASSSSDGDMALEYLQKAKAAAVAISRSPASWLMQELELRILRSEGAEANELFQQIQRDHAEEPGVGEALWSMLEHYGLAPNQPPPGAAPANSPMPGMSSPQQADPFSAPPMAGEPAPTSEESPSKIWVPGMD